LGLRLRLLNSWGSRSVGPDIRSRRSTSCSGAIVGNTEADDINHARNLILDVIGKVRWQLLAGKLQVAQVHSKREFGEIELASTSGISKSPVMYVNINHDNYKSGMPIGSSPDMR
jgi:hypothetical protein